ncbi:SusD/RagB family nutrient-binding outer membrane lipoprotein [Flavobacterium phycosphaerae]|uniref:SusD/RagB family nutrient-binding outer membrane lipoprotein n=1 Tax=Flavobacterium phycosphaerae TaxID=2697515 RepID=UPI001389C2F4|nr:SusD/RagB family nutrient-binding outer membrane lipoprotein [Flavobacterium phycosphaerae]
MKLINKIRNNKTIVVLSLFTTFFVSCSDYLDVDKDTDYPTTAPLNLLLTNAQVSTALVGDFNNNTGRLLSTYTHQMTSREEEDQYGIKVNNINMNNDWDAIYLGLTDLETIIKQGTDTGNMVYVGVAQMQKAYLMSYAVDLWGDVPYSEATQLATSGIINPKFDNQKAIYADIFALIETAKINLASDLGNEKPGTDDLYYGGNTDKWIRFANTFKLKLYNQTRLTTDFDQAGFDALIAEDNFFTSNADDFQFNRYDAISPSNERNQLFIAAYEGTQFSEYQSPWFYEILKGVNPNIHNGNPDPRMHYYFYNQLTAGEFPPDQGNTVTGDPGADYWDASTGFFSIRFGSVGPDRDKSAENSYTYPGIFPCGGRYDDEQGGSVATLDTDFSGKGIAPHRILTYDEFLYIKAELIQVGKLTGNAAATLQDAVTASFAKVDQVVANSGTNQTVPVLTGSPEVATFIGNIMTEFNAASAAKKLEIIMTQKWVGTFGDPMDQYTDYRRTGYPVLADPMGASPEYQLNNGDGFPIIDSQTVQNNAFQLSFYWPQSELNSNANAPAQKNPATYKIFWDN